MAQGEQSYPRPPSPHVPTLTTLGEILKDRGEKYGPFITHAEISQRIKREIFGTKPRHQLSADKVEALEMIAHKIARIINGDPEYADSWDDIAGYATLVANRIKQSERERLDHGNTAKTAK